MEVEGRRRSALVAAMPLLCIYTTQHPALSAHFIGAWAGLVPPVSIFKHAMRLLWAPR